MVEGNGIRKMAYAGQFYPREAEDLLRTIEDLFTEADDGSLARETKPGALIVPHAGYIYSGAVAARGYREVLGRKYSRILLMGPYHFNPLKGHYFKGPGPASYSALESPLGKIEYDRETSAILASALGAEYQQGAHAGEHSLEVQLPFIVYSLPGTPVSLLLMGDSKFEDTARVATEVARVIGTDDYLVIVSTDLSHFYQYDRARELDNKSLDLVLNGKVEELYEWDRSTGGMLCGADGILAIMQVAALRKWAPPVLLSYQNSGDRGGGRREVVGYASIVYYRAKEK